MAINSRQKGAKGERELSKVLHGYGYNCRRGQQYCGANGDADVVGLPGIHNVLILLVAHRRKNSFTTDANDEVSGSGDITNLAGLVLSYDRADKKEIDEGRIDESQRKIIIAKNRLFGKLDLKGIVVSYDEKSKRIYSSPDELGYRYGWDIDNWDYDVPADDNPFN